MRGQSVMKTYKINNDDWLFSVRGVSFEPHPKNIRSLWENKDQGIDVRLNHDAYNAFDPFALQVLCNDMVVGFVPRQWNRQILENGLSNLRVTFRGFQFFDGRVVGVSISCRKLRGLKAQMLTQQIKSNPQLVQKLTSTPRRIRI